MKLITPISDSIFKKLNEEELLLINELYLEMEKYKNVIDKILKLKKYTSLMEYDEEFIKVKDIKKLLEEVE